MYLGMIVSQVMELSSKDFWKMVKDLEEDPLFIKLYSLKSGGRNAIKINPRRFLLELDEGIKSSAGVWQDNVENYLEGREALIKKLKALGPDKFTTLFLSGDASPLEVSEATGLSPEEVRLFQNEVLDNIFIDDQFTPEPGPVPAAIKELVGVVEIQGRTPVFQPVQEKERYLVYGENVEAAAREGVLTDKEIGRIPDVLRKANFINMRLNMISIIAAYLVDFQRPYILTGDKKKLAVLEGKELAGKLDIDPGWLSRLIKGKVVRTPAGEIPLSRLFMTRRKAKKEQGKDLLKRLLNTYPARRPSDRVLCEEIASRFGVKVSRRTVNLWRKEMEGQ